MTDREPNPLERTQIIEIFLKKYEFGKDNTASSGWLDHEPLKIGKAFEQDADVLRHLAVLRSRIADFKRAHDATSAEAATEARDAALSAVIDLRRVIAERTIN